jgi:murein DD-endopeptidase MepM/ murein hydrolase activator NlpD
MTDSKVPVYRANLLHVRARIFFAVMLALAVLPASSSAGAAPAVQSSASAFGVRVIVPGKNPATAGAITSPPQAASSLVRWSYGDGAVSVGAISAGTRATTGDGRAVSRAAVSISSISLFGGEVTADSVSLKATAHASSSVAGGTLADSSVTNVAVFGEPVAIGVNGRVALGDWGYAVLLEQAVVRQNTASRRGHRGFVAGMHVHLTADHGGLPAGTEIYIGYGVAAATALKQAPAPPPAPPPDHTPPPDDHHHHHPPSDSPEAPPVASPPSDINPQLTEDGYVFPVYGPSSFTDDFRAGRASTGWHHGNDIFAPVGAPVLAVAEGTLFLVGWNTIGGNRLWLRDMQGNEFYYAHLSAFSPLAKEGQHVEAGDVIGFVGATGDAVGTPPHLHFEIHPVELLWMGYDGVINPYPYLLAWRRQADVSFDVSGWTPPAGKAPPPPVVLLQADDISAVSGLDPSAFSTVLDVGPMFGEGPPGPTIVEAESGSAAG